MPLPPSRPSVGIYSRVGRIVMCAFSGGILAASCGVCGVGLKDRIPAEEYDALVALYNATDGANWTNTSSFLEPEVLNWRGVLVTGDKIKNGEVTEIGNVTGLSLNGNKLKGKIPESIGDLPKLTYLNLSFNELTGDIPSRIGDLVELEILDLSWNSFTGGIPNRIGDLLSLTELTITDASLTGPIPSDIGNLSSLTHLFLRRNQLSGSLPSSIGNLDKLEWLYVSENALSGSIPSSIGSLSSLTNLRLGNNQLSGSIPSSIGNLSNAVNIWISDNQLSGPIPDSIGDMTSLSNLSLSNNQLSGVIPNSLGDLTSLTILSLGSNQLTGSIPISLGDVTGFYALSLERNQLSGSIPDSLGNLVGLRYLDLWDNQLTGSIPARLGDLTSLVRFTLFSNNLAWAVDSADWTFTRSRLISAGVSAGAIEDRPQSNPTYFIIMRWPDGTPLANVRFEINGVARSTDGSGILITTDIPPYRSDEFPIDYVRLNRDGEIASYPLGQIDIPQAGVAGFYVLNLFNITEAYIDLLHFELIPDSIRLKFATEVGVLYHLEESSDLKVWSDLGYQLVGDGTVLEFSISDIGNLLKFIRIKAESE